MRPSAFLLLILLLGLSACAARQELSLPQLTADAREDKGCDSVFPQGRWQFVHAIDYSMEDGSGTTVIGVTSLAGDEISCALMTVEGLTLFEAVDRPKGGLEVRRAVPPFDKPTFAEGLMEDVRTIFRAPAPATMQYGRSAGHGRPSVARSMDGKKATATTIATCRYTGVDGRITDVLPAVDGCWQIRSYTADHTMNRSVTGRSCRKNGASLIPERLELRGFGHTDYTLKMTLIQAENLGAVSE